MTEASAAREADWFSKPGDTIKSLMQARQMAPDEFAAHIPGGLGTLRQLLEGTAEIDLTIASSLAKHLGGSPQFWLKRQQNYEAALNRAVQKASETEADEWLNQIPAPGPRTSTRISDQKRQEELRRRLVFYNVANLKSWDARYGDIPETHFRTSPSFRSNRSSVLWWLRRGEMEADLISTAKWSPDRLRQLLTQIRALTKLSRPIRFLPKLRQILVEAGVALVVVPTPKGCHASGAARLIAPDKALILISFRHRSDDQFWFTLFHEIGHLLLHKGRAFVDEEETADSPAEREANEFAASCIVPFARWSEFQDLKPDRDSIMRFAVSVGVSPGLIVGQMQHEGRIDFRRMSNLKRHWTWDEIRPAAGLD
jgi:Zn-dependent peptidase ImmA (M78 family)/plasmid maintenance system antidote protein VapI